MEVLQGIILFKDMEPDNTLFPNLVHLVKLDSILLNQNFVEIHIVNMFLSILLLLSLNPNLNESINLRLKNECYLYQVVAHRL